ncbi:MAG: amidohydrolase [Proteobacteria bacterium]|nr:MAG: amidohydrolase [Pseudomonadota bacterium]
MDLSAEAVSLQSWMTGIRRDIHRHPEIGFQERRTADLVAKHLAAMGMEVATGIGGTGVVGTLRAGTGTRTIGLRADMDALPMQESSDKPYQSIHGGIFHGCGHDGHIAMLLGAARAISESRDFDGAVHFIFQPAEEGLGGALAMMQDGLFQRFPCDMIYGLHNWPHLPLGTFGVRPGPMMAAFSTFDINIKGIGGHAAMPHTTIDPVIAAASLIQSLQSIVSRVLDPVDAAVVSVTQLHGGSAYNIIPDLVALSGCCRYFSDLNGQKISAEMIRRAQMTAAASGATAEVAIKEIYTILLNEEEETVRCADIAAAIVGEAHVVKDHPPIMASEDFAFMLREVPGCYILMGAGDPDHACMVHNPGYDFNDEALVVGATYWQRLVEAALRKP